VESSGSSSRQFGWLDADTGAKGFLAQVLEALDVFIILRLGRPRLAFLKGECLERGSVLATGEPGREVEKTRLKDTISGDWTKALPQADYVQSCSHEANAFSRRGQAVMICAGLV